jgi:hypothetical protein
MLVVVGGHSRNVGKTSVVCGIIEGLRDWNWTAIKITQYGHGVCTHEGEACECADPRHPVAVSEETGADATTDSGRFLAAGAGRAYWLRTSMGHLAEALPRLRHLLSGSENTIVESNSLVQLLRPDLFLLTVDGAVADFKPTSLWALDRADALVVTSPAELAWPGVPRSLIASKPRFEAFAPVYRDERIVAAIRLKNSTVPADICSR